MSKKLDEEITTGGVDGLGLNSGTPATQTDYVSKYVNGNAMSYVDENGNKLAWMKKHRKGHNAVGFKEFDPTELTKKKESLRKRLDERKLPPRVRKAVATGATLANIATLGMGGAEVGEGRGKPSDTLSALATTAPGPAGYAATAAHYGRKIYKHMTQQDEECWKGYEQIGMKKKGKRKVPNCVPVHETNEEVDFDRAMAAFRKKETGSYEGRYDAAGKPGRSASGAYQFIDKTWRGVTKRQGVGTEYKHASDAPREIQDKVMRGELENNVKRYGSLEKAVNYHYTGNPEGRMSGKARSANAGQNAGKYYSDFEKNMTAYTAPKQSEPAPTQVASVSKEPEQTKVSLIQPKNEPGDNASSFVRKQLSMRESTIEEGNKVNKTKKKALLNVIKRKKKSDGHAEPFDPRRMLAPHNRKKASDSQHVAEEKKDQGYQNWPGEKKKKFFQGPKDKEGKTETQKWAEKRQKEREKGIAMKKQKEKIDEVAMAMPPQIQPPSITRPAPAKQFSRSVTTNARMGSGAGAMRGGVQVQRAAPARPATFSQGQGGTMKVSSTNVGPRAAAPSAPSGRLASSGAGAMQGTPKVSSGGLGRSAEYSRSLVGSMSDKLDTVSRGMGKAAPAISKAAPAVASGIAKGVSTAARVLGGPVAGAAMAAMDSSPAGEKQSEFQRQDSLKNGNNPFKAQGRSIKDYENDTFNKKKPEAPAAAPYPKADVPTPPTRPDYMSRGDAFKAARGEAGGGEGKFSYDNKDYQTNKAGEPYKPASQLKPTSVKEATMDTLETINEALDNIIEENMIDMRENFIAVLQEKAMQKLEERKKEIASQYFAQ